eukprot:352616-Chlamydomonas_euryale.AAC.17
MRAVAAPPLCRDTLTACDCGAPGRLKHRGRILCASRREARGRRVGKGSAARGVGGSKAGWGGEAVADAFRNAPTYVYSFGALACGAFS